MLEVWRGLRRQAAKLSRQLIVSARQSQACQILMSIPGVGAVTATSFATAIEDPGNFRKSRSVGAALRQAFLQPDQDGARKVWRTMADQFRDRWPKLARLLDESEHDVLAYLFFPAQHRAKLHSTNPLERLPAAPTQIPPQAA